MPQTPLLPDPTSLAQQLLRLWDVPAETGLRLINLSENATYLAEAADGFRAVLRLHRPGYHSRRAIECELAWMEALAAEAVIETPAVIAGRDGEALQQIGAPALPDSRFAVLFEFIEGTAPDETGNLAPGFEILGALAARCHRHAEGWAKPKPFERLTWDLENVFGPAAPWGDWRDAPGVTYSIRPVLEEVESTLRHRLTRYGKAADRYNLIHADMRFANLLITKDKTRVIDFDDCGWGWFMYDFAAAISFVEDAPEVPLWRDAWLRGYQRIRPLAAEDIAEIDSMVLLRRMALLAWIGSHMEAPEPQALAPHFAEGTAKLGRTYLQKMSVLT